jgi:hypothetical protein
MKSLILAAVGAAILAASSGMAAAQPATAPLRFNAYGQPVCPSNYEVRGNVCVNPYVTGEARRGGYYRERYRGDYDDGPPRRGRAAYGRSVAPIMTPRGPLCPSNYEIRGGMCVTPYY